MSIAQSVCRAINGDLKDMLGKNACLIPGPGHGKDDRSLSVKDDPSNADGFVVNSFAGDDPAVCRDYVREAAGLPSWKATRSERPADPQFVYRDQHGEPYLRVTKVHKGDGKSFYQHKWSGSEWVKGGQQVRIPYRLPEVVAARDIYIVEGEKDADRLASLGLVATCNPMGAGKWRDELNQWFDSKSVVILADNDETGRQHAAQVEEALRGNTASVRTVHFQMLPEKGDVSDWLDTGKSKADLLAYVAGGTKERLTSFNARDLMDMEFDPVRYVVPGYIAEGCTILAGASKLGKSWLVLQAAMAVARGSTCLGGTCEQGDVLYLALEDNPRRLKERLRMQNPADGVVGRRMPTCLQFETEWPRADQGGIARIEEWLKEHPSAKLVIVDVLKMFRAQRKGNKNPYDLDYEDINPLSRLAAEYNVAIVVVHHTNKGALSSDPFDRVNGTGGISGAADTTIILARNDDGLVELYGRGRDIEEIETAVSFDKTTCRWSVRGNAAEVHMSDAAAGIMRAMREADEPMGPNAIATAAGLKSVIVRQHLPRLAKAGEIQKEGRGKWAIALKVTPPSNPPLQTSQTSQSGAEETKVTNVTNVMGGECRRHKASSDVTASGQNPYQLERDGEASGDVQEAEHVGDDDIRPPRGHDLNPDEFEPPAFLRRPA